MIHLPTNDELANLRMTFPLYQAPLRTLTDLAGPGLCSIDGNRHEHRFILGIGSDLIIPCPSCGQPTDLDVADAASKTCSNCANTIPFPPPWEGEDTFAVCYGCLRAGKAAITHDTEFGMVRWQDAIGGLTHGVPGLHAGSVGNNGFALGPPHAGDEEWRGVYVPQQLLMELVRTPNYSTWQGDTWFFHCGGIMCYLGEWTIDDFDRARPADPRGLFAEIIAPSRFWEREWELLGSDSCNCYVHGCQRCGALRAYCDMD